MRSLTSAPEPSAPCGTDFADTSSHLLCWIREREDRITSAAGCLSVPVAPGRTSMIKEACRPHAVVASHAADFKTEGVSYRSRCNAGAAVIGDPRMPNAVGLEVNGGRANLAHTDGRS